MGSESYRQLWSHSVHKISRFILPLLSTLPLLCFCQLLSWSVHRKKCSNLSTIHWFHSACTSVSMLAIDANNRLFLRSCFPVIPSGLCVYVKVSVFKSGLQPRHHIHQRLRQPSSWSGAWDPFVSAPERRRAKKLRHEEETGGTRIEAKGQATQRGTHVAE